MAGSRSGVSTLAQARLLAASTCSPPNWVADNDPDSSTPDDRKRPGVDALFCRQGDTEACRHCNPCSKAGIGPDGAHERAEAPILGCGLPSHSRSTLVAELFRSPIHRPTRQLKVHWRTLAQVSESIEPTQSTRIVGETASSQEREA
jgi:hypothetical protein